MSEIYHNEGEGGIEKIEIKEKNQQQT